MEIFASGLVAFVQSESLVEMPEQPLRQETKVSIAATATIFMSYSLLVVMAKCYTDTVAEYKKGASEKSVSA